MDSMIFPLRRIMTHSLINFPNCNHNPKFITTFVSLMLGWIWAWQTDTFIVMTPHVCREKSLYYRPNTDHFPSKYRPNTNRFSSYFPKIQTNIIFLDQILKIVQSRGRDVLKSLFQSVENRPQRSYIFHE